MVVSVCFSRRAFSQLQLIGDARRSVMCLLEFRLREGELLHRGLADHDDLFRERKSGEAILEDISPGILRDVTNFLECPLPSGSLTSKDFLLIFVFSIEISVKIQNCT